MQDFRSEALLLTQQSEQQVLGANVLMAEALGLFGAVGQHALALMAEGQVHRGGHLLADGGVGLHLLSDGFDGGVRAQKAIGQRLVLAQQAQQ